MAFDSMRKLRLAINLVVVPLSLVEVTWPSRFFCVEPGYHVGMAEVLFL
jgi:hypothetical protein